MFEGKLYKINENDPFRGIVYNTYPNAQREYEGEYKDGQPNGLLVYWYAKGNKMYIPLFTKIKEYDDNSTIINTPKCMRFHCLSIPHTITNDDYNV